MKVLGYIRCSTDEQASDGGSLPVQKAKIEAYCRLYDLELIDVMVDDGESGKSLKRPGIIAALGMLKQGLVQGLVVTKLDRLSRSVSDWDKLIAGYFGERAGRQLFSVGDSIDTRTAAGRLVLNVLMSVAQWEREAIGERTKEGMAYLGEQKRLRGEVPFGFDVVERTVQADEGQKIVKELVENADEQAVIEQIRDWKADGLGSRAIARKLTAAQIKTKTGNIRWCHTAVARILRRPSALQAA